MLVVDSGMKLQTMLEVIQAYMMRWRMKFSSRKSKIEERWNKLKNWRGDNGGGRKI